MIKISRNFCRYSTVLSYYEFYINKTECNDTILKNNFYTHLTRVIKNTFTIIYFIDFLVEVINNEEDNPYEGNSEFGILKNNTYKEILSIYKIFSDKDFELTNDMITTFKNYQRNTHSLSELFNNIAENENIINTLDIDPSFYSKYNKNITTQIINIADENNHTELQSLINIKSNYKKSNDFCETILEEMQKNIDDIKNEISTTAQKWTDNRIHTLEKIIMGLAISEFKVFQTPIQVVINEYINISKELCGQKTSIFINGLLDPILKKIQNNSNINQEKP